MNSKNEREKPSDIYEIKVQFVNLQFFCYNKVIHEVEIMT